MPEFSLEAEGTVVNKTSSSRTSSRLEKEEWRSSELQAGVVKLWWRGARCHENMWKRYQTQLPKLKDGVPQLGLKGKIGVI